MAARNTLLKELKEAAERKEALRTRFRELADRRELLEMHLTEIEKVSPAEGEEEQLEAMRAEWRGTEQLRRHYERAQMILRGEETGLLEQIGHLERALELLAGDDEDMAAYLESTVSFRQTIAELERKLRRPPLPQADIDPEQIEARLSNWRSSSASFTGRFRKSLPSGKKFRTTFRFSTPARSTSGKWRNGKNSFKNNSRAYWPF